MPDTILPKTISAQITLLQQEWQEENAQIKRLYSLCPLEGGRLVEFLLQQIRQARERMHTIEAELKVLGGTLEPTISSVQSNSSPSHPSDNDNIGQVLCTLVTELKDKVQQIAEFVTLTREDRFRYTASQASTFTQSEPYYPILATFYYDPSYNEQPNTRFCMATGAWLAEEAVIAVHLSKHAWASRAKAELKLDNIDDPRNGFLVCRAVEPAFNNSKISIEVHSNNTMTWRVLDERIRTQNLSEETHRAVHRSQKDTASRNVHFPPAISQITFNDLDGQPVHFPHTTRPFRRCLAYQAARALNYAQKNWPAHCKVVTLQKCWSPENLSFESVTNILNWQQSVS